MQIWTIWISLGKSNSLFEPRFFIVEIKNAEDPRWICIRSQSEEPWWYYLARCCKLGVDTSILSLAPVEINISKHRTLNLSYTHRLGDLSLHWRKACCKPISQVGSSLDQSKLRLRERRTSWLSSQHRSQRARIELPHILINFRAVEWQLPRSQTPNAQESLLYIDMPHF